MRLPAREVTVRLVGRRYYPTLPRQPPFLGSTVLLEGPVVNRKAWHEGRVNKCPIRSCKTGLAGRRMAVL